MLLRIHVITSGWNMQMRQGDRGIAVPYSPRVYAPSHLQWQLENFSRRGRRGPPPGGSPLQEGASRRATVEAGWRARDRRLEARMLLLLTDV